MSIDDDQPLDPADGHVLFDCLRRGAVCYQRWTQSGSDAQLSAASAWIDMAVWCCLQIDPTIDGGVWEIVQEFDAFIRRATQ